MCINPKSAKQFFSAAHQCSLPVHGMSSLSENAFVGKEPNSVMANAEIPPWGTITAKPPRIGP